MRNSFEAGGRDPGLLYLGARYSASLGFLDQACLFLKPLQEILGGGTDGKIYAPVALLNLYVLPPGEERNSMAQDLHRRISQHPKLSRILNASCGHLLGGSGDPKDLPLPTQREAKQLQDILAEYIGSDTSSPSCPREVVIIKAASRAATQAYRAGNLDAARYNLENALLQDGYQPDILHNLIIVASEQQDMEAYRRYWRRYVKISLWRMMCNDQYLSTWNDLIHFYSHVAMTTDRKFMSAGPDVAENLRRPGLLAAWLESHAALIWLEANGRPLRQQQTGLTSEDLTSGHLGYLSLMKCWLRAFYPEFLAFADLGASGDCYFTPEGKNRYLCPFDPAEKILIQFVRWSRINFGIQSFDETHIDAVVALAECVARIPWQSYVNKLQDLSRGEDLASTQFSHMMQEVGSAGLQPRIQKLLQEKNWERLVSFLGELDIAPILTPSVRMLLALAHCKLRKPQHGLTIALQAIPEMEDSDLATDSECWTLLHDIVHLNVELILNDEKFSAAKPINLLQEKILKIEGQDGVRLLRDSLLRIIAEAQEHLLIKNTVEESRKLVEQGKFEAARNLVVKLPDAPKEIAELKKQLLGQIDDAEQQHKLQQQIDAAIEECKRLIGLDHFPQARQVIRKLPESPKEVAELKKQLLGQIDDAEQQHKLQQQIEAAVAECKRLVAAQKFTAARTVIQMLPDSNDLAKLKQNLLSQVREVENEYKQANQENARILQELARTNINVNKIGDIAKLNKINMNDALALNSLLKAIKEQLGI